MVDCKYSPFYFLGEGVWTFKGNFKVLVKRNPSLYDILRLPIGSLEEILDEYLSFKANDQLQAVLTSENYNFLVLIAPDYPSLNDALNLEVGAVLEESRPLQRPSNAAAISDVADIFGLYTLE